MSFRAFGFVTVLTLLAAAFAGCSGEMSFEKITGPMSPGSLAMMVSGGLRERLFPGSQKAFEVCMEDPQACADAGGYTLQLTPAGKVALTNLKTMLALQLSGKSDPDFEKACETFSSQLFNERDPDGYEVSMRLLGLFTADPESDLHCATRNIEALWKNEFRSRRIDWDVLKLTGYVELVLAGRGLWGKRAPIRGVVGGAARLVILSGSGYFVFKGASGVAHTLDLDAWARESARSYFGGALGWKRKYTDPETLLTRFRRKLGGAMPGSSPDRLASDLNNLVRP